MFLIYSPLVLSLQMVLQVLVLMAIAIIQALHLVVKCLALSLRSTPLVLILRFLVAVFPHLLVFPLYSPLLVLQTLSLLTCLQPSRLQVILLVLSLQIKRPKPLLSLTPVS